VPSPPDRAILYRTRVFDTPDDPFAGAGFRYGPDVGLVVVDGTITARGDFVHVRREHPEAWVIDLRDGVLLPGLVDTHVHFPQVRAMGALGMPLLEWLDRCALPEEMRLADPRHATAIASEFVSGLVAAGTTSALVFGSHYAAAVDALFAEAARFGLRVTSGLVVSDRNLPEPLLTTPARAYEEALALVERWHGVGRARYAVTPRFSLSAGEELLASCGEVLDHVEGAWFTSHVNENPTEVAVVRDLFPERRHYVDTYAAAGLLGPRSVLAHDVHPLDEELEVLGSTRTVVSHCPSSNAALGSGSFPFLRHHRAGVRVALGCDVGAGTGFSLFKEGLQAYFTQSLLGADGLPLTAAHLLWLATAAGADALGLERVGHLSPGMAFDAICVRPRAGTALDVCVQHAESAGDLLGKIFALAGDADVADVWVGGYQIASGGFHRPVP
jgi:guanine deaminase